MAQRPNASRPRNRLRGFISGGIRGAVKSQTALRHAPAMRAGLQSAAVQVRMQGRVREESLPRMLEKEGTKTRELTYHLGCAPQESLDAVGDGQKGQSET